MITTQVVAEVRRVLRGHSDRALVHAVDGEGLEYKIEVPLDQVQALSSEQGHVVTITYAIHALPGLAPPMAETSDAGAEAPTAPAPEAPTPAPEAPAPAAGVTSGAASDPASVDAAFMALMNRRTTAGSPAAPPASSNSSSASMAGQVGSPTPPPGGPTSAARPSLDAMVDEFLGRR